MSAGLRQANSRLSARKSEAALEEKDSLHALLAVDHGAIRAFLTTCCKRFGTKNRPFFFLLPPPGLPSDKWPPFQLVARDTDTRGA